MEVFQYRIPVWHPIAVHFPPALLVVAVGAASGWLVWGGKAWRRTLLGLLALSTLGTTFAYFTGEAMKQRATGAPIVEELVDLHEQLALYTFIGTGLAFACMGSVSAWNYWRAEADDVPRWVRLVIGLVVAAAAVLVAFTAHVGGTMTWGVPI